MSRFILTFLLVVDALLGQSPQQIMETSVAKQRESVRRQANPPANAPKDWFTVPWPRVLPLVPGSSVVATNASACQPLPQTAMDSLIREAADRQGYSADLLRAVVKQESGGDPCAISPKGALGLMQLMPATASDLGVKNVFDPVENLAAGARLLGQLLVRYAGDTAKALGAYNAGPAVVDAYNGVPPFAETKNYIASILGGE